MRCRTVVAALACAGLNAALPSGPRLTLRQLDYHTVSRRQNAAAAALGLNDFDILTFALTLEHLEEAFYREALTTIAAADFTALGLSDAQLLDMQAIGKTEAQHVTFLSSALAQGGITPVALCEYDFSPFLSQGAAGVVGAAAVLENVGLSAYLGAAPLLADPGLLGVAGSILTVESRHQTAIRAFSPPSTAGVSVKAVPQAFDAPLGPRAVFSIAAPLIKSCPEGSNLQIEPFPALTLEQSGAAVAVGGAVVIDTLLNVQSEGAAAATHCAFTSGGVLPGGTKFTPFTQQDGCLVPQGIAGISYVSLSSSGPLEGVLTDDMVLAGPAVVTVS